MPDSKSFAKSIKRKARELIQVVFLALLAALILRATVVSAYHVPTGSMIPTLLVGDQFLAFPSAYDLKVPFTDISVVPLSEPKRGDVITFKSPTGEGPDWVKRIIGLPGETIFIRGTRIYINGKLFDDPWGSYTGGPMAWRGDFGPVTVPPGKYFMLGDNRDNSNDSRFWAGRRGGFVPREHIHGKALVIHWSTPQKAA
jgi:signal peptidase I